MRPADVEGWLSELGLTPAERADRDGIASWDLVLDGRRRFDLRITVVGKRAVIPRGVRIGRNVKIAADVRSSDFAGRVVRSGESVDRKRPARVSRTTGTSVEAAKGSVAVGAAPVTSDKKVVDAS